MFMMACLEIFVLQLPIYRIDRYIYIAVNMHQLEQQPDSHAR